MGKKNEIDYLTLAKKQSDTWEVLCERYLPVKKENSIWRFSRESATDDPGQGWKLHISATVLSANSILERVAPFLCGLGVLFKAPQSLEELSRINCGLYYGFSQVGKFITVYSRSADEALSIARHLHRLTHKQSGPTVPYDRRYRDYGCVFYRYGAYSHMYVEKQDGAQLPAIRTPDGELVPDLREPGASVPNWTTDPFLKHSRKQKKEDTTISPLKTTIRAYEALLQRGKGGVYRALDLSVSPARLCILKEGRSHGETDWCGRDGQWRLRHEVRVLSSLSQADVPVPQIYQSFDDGYNFYAAMEFIDGQSLQSSLTSAKNRLPLVDALNYAIQTANLVDKIHSAGWVWRDCKPLNLILTKKGKLRPIDFEGACPIDEPDKMPWGTTGYTPPEWLAEPLIGSRLAEDLYALGVTILQLIAGHTPDEKELLNSVRKLKRRIPSPARGVVSALIDVDPRSRPTARTVAKTLKSI